MAPYHSAEENEIERLRYQIAVQEDAHRDELKRMKWQLRREQDRSKQLQIDLKHAATDQRPRTRTNYAPNRTSTNVTKRSR